MTGTTVALRPARWVISPSVDVLFVLVGGLLLSVILYFAWRAGPAFLVAAIAFAIVADFPHVLQTYARILLDPAEYAVYGREFRYSLVVITVVVVTCVVAGQYGLLVLAWVYWQPFHVVKQHDGMVSIYAARSGYAHTRRLAKLTLFTGCAAPILARVSSRGLAFGTYRPLGIELPFSGLTIPTPPVPAFLVAVTYGVFGALLVAFIVEQVRLSRQGAALPLPSLANLAIAIICYNGAYLLVDDLYAVILIATAVHSLQYDLLSWTRNNRRFEGKDIRRPGMAARERVLAALSQRRALPLYVLGFAAAGALCSLSELALQGALPLIIVFHHFYLDGIVWKGSRNPQLVEALGLRRQTRPAQVVG